MEADPFSYQFKSLMGQCALQDLSVGNRDRSHIIAIDGVDMRRVVFLLQKVHTDNDPVKSR